MITQDKATWEKEGNKLYGTNKKKWQFKCPRCGKISTPQEFEENGIEGIKALSNCIGRFVKDKGCDWTAGGLLGTLGSGRRIKDNGVTYEIFSFHTDEDAVIDDIESKAVGLGIKKWSDFTWDDWVPQEVREQIEDFWNEDWHRSPDEWARNAIQNNAPNYGEIVTLRSLRGGKATGRFVHAWNNIGRLVHENGTFSYVSF